MDDNYELVRKNVKSFVVTAVSTLEGFLRSGISVPSRELASVCSMISRISIPSSLLVCCSSHALTHVDT